MKSTPPPFLNFRREEWAAAMYIGGLCGALVVLMAQGRLGGLLVNYVPTLLLFGLGWVRGVRPLGLAAIIATIVCLIGAPGAASIFLVAEALPALLLVRLALTYLAIGQPQRADGNGQIALHVMPAFSTGWAVGAVAVYGACMLAVFALLMPATTGPILSQNDWNNIDALLASRVPDAVARKAALAFIRQYLFVVLGLMGWVWALGLYGCAALARLLAEGIYPVAPRRLDLLPFSVPLALLGLLAVFGAGALALPASSVASVLLKAAFLLLLLPYFLSGVASAFARLPNRQARIFCVLPLMLGLVFFPFGVLIFIAMGLLHPLKSPSPPSTLRD